MAKRARERSAEMCYAGLADSARGMDDPPAAATSSMPELGQDFSSSLEVSAQKKGETKKKGRLWTKPEERGGGSPSAGLAPPQAAAWREKTCGTQESSSVRKGRRRNSSGFSPPSSSSPSPPWYLSEGKGAPRRNRCCRPLSHKPPVPPSTDMYPANEGAATASRDLQTDKTWSLQSFPPPSSTSFSILLSGEAPLREWKEGRRRCGWKWDPRGRAGGREALSRGMKREGATS